MTLTALLTTLLPPHSYPSSDPNPHSNEPFRTSECAQQKCFGEQEDMSSASIKSILTCSASESIMNLEWMMWCGMIMESSLVLMAEGYHNVVWMFVWLWMNAVCRCLWCWIVSMSLISDFCIVFSVMLCFCLGTVCFVSLGVCSMAGQTTCSHDCCCVWALLILDLLCFCFWCFFSSLLFCFCFCFCFMPSRLSLFLS
jgi:hypothetical protein